MFQHPPTYLSPRTDQTPSPSLPAKLAAFCWQLAHLVPHPGGVSHPLTRAHTLLSANVWACGYVSGVYRGASPPTPRTSKDIRGQVQALSQVGSSDVHIIKRRHPSAAALLACFKKIHGTPTYQASLAIDLVGLLLASLFTSLHLTSGFSHEFPSH